MKINICKDFSDTPGARYRTEGDFSGEEFRERFLIPSFEELKNTDEKIEINFDGGYGYPTSFLEEAFGGLARKFGSNVVLKKLRFISNDEPELIKEVETYIKTANSKGARTKDEK